MTTVVANPSGRKSAKDKKTNPNKNASPPTVTPNSVPETINNNSEEFRNKSDKFQPTAEQMRIASLMTSDKKDENDLKPKIEQIVELTGASRDDAAVALFDCDNDMAKAIEMILDGDSLESEWHSTGRKKKTKAQIAGQPELLTNGTKKTEKSSRPNLKNNNAVGITAAPPTNATKGQGRGAFNATNRVVRKKDGRPSDSKPETVEESDIFAKALTDPAVAGGDPARRGSRRGAPRGGGRGGGGGIPRGKGPAAGRGSRTFMNRGLQNNDGFPNSIETWTNSTAEQTKPNNDDLNTMTVGNWSDIAANEDWSEEDWTSAPLETKVFTPSTKTISEKDEIIAEQNSSINNTSQNSTQLSFVSPNKNEESAQPTMSAILSGNIKRSSVATPGQALLQQIQQSSASQNSNLNQYNLSQYSKQATESIKSLVGLSSNNMIPNDLIPANEHSLDSNLTQVSKQPTQTQNQQNRLKVQNQKAPSKIPETAVEMPSNDPISNLSVHFGSLEFGTNNPYVLDPNMFDSVNQNANAKQENKNNLSLLASNTDNTSNSNFRSPNSNASQNKSILQSSVLPPTLNDSLLNSDHRNEKPLNANNYASNKQQIERKNEYMNMTYKPSYVNNENAYSSAYQTSIPSNVGYYSNSTQVTPFGNSAGQSMMTSNVYNTTYNNVSANAANNQQNVPKIRDIDNSVPQQQVAANSVSASNKPYESASNVGTSLSLMSNSTVTTNVLKNTLSATGKGVHNVPPGVQPTQVGQVLQAPYIMSNAGMPIPYPYPYEMQSFTPRDHGYPYAAADVKYNRGTESDMLPVSSQAAGAVQTATQAHNQPYMNTYPPGYGVYFTGFNFAHQGLYNAAQHALYPVPQAQTTAGSAGSAFPKANTAASYGSHSYNSGYDSLGAAVAQTQDYVNKAYPQQMQPHKQMSGTNTGDLSGNNPQNMYNKAHSQMNKNYEKQGFQQQSAQFNLANTTQSAANLSSYAAPYLLPQQSMHHTLASAEQTQQPPGVGNQRSLSQTHKGASSNASYGKFNWN